MSKRPTETKTCILKATRTLYSTHGFNGTTLNDILTASGITKGAFYHYFKSKDSLCEETLDDVILDYKNLTESIDADIEPIEQLRWLIRKIADLNTSGQWVNCRLMLRFSTDSHESNPEIQRKIKQFWQWYTGFFEELIIKSSQASQLDSQLEPKTLARLLMSVLAGAVVLDKAAPTDSETPLNTVIKILLS